MKFIQYTIFSLFLASGINLFGLSFVYAEEDSVTVPYTITGVDAADYEDKLNGKLVFKKGESSKEITLTIKNDEKVEEDETFAITLSVTDGVTLSEKKTVTGTILNDDFPTVAISTKSITKKEGEGGDSTKYSFPLILEGFPRDETTTITYDIRGEGLKTTDFAGKLTDIQLSLPPGVGNANLDIYVANNDVVEGDKTFEVVITELSEGVILKTGGVAKGIIQNDDVDYCADTPCNNGGTCSNDPENETFQCTCAEEYEGETCEKVIQKLPVAKDLSIKIDEDTESLFSTSFSDPSISTEELADMGSSAREKLRPNINITKKPKHGEVSVSFVSGDNAEIVTYKPNTNWSGEDSFSYTITSARTKLTSNEATTTITVTPVNDAPTVKNRITDQEITAGDELKIDVYSAFSDADEDVLTITGKGLPEGAVLVGIQNTEKFFMTRDRLSDVGEHTITITADDKKGGKVSMTFKLTVTKPNSDPVAQDDEQTLSADSKSTIIKVLNNDADPDKNDKLTVTTIDTTGTTGLATLSGGVLRYDPDGAFASLGIGKSAVDTFTYTVSDSHGGTDTATVKITISGVNSAPEAKDDSVATDADLTFAANDSERAITADILGNDSDANSEDTLAVTAIDTTGTTGLATLSGGVLRYDPDGAFASLGIGKSAVDTFTYTVSDSHGGTDTATVKITIEGVKETTLACPSDQIKCSDGTCKMMASECPTSTSTLTTTNTCPSSTPIRCDDGRCMVSQEDCSTTTSCAAPTPFKCPDGSCKATATECTTASTTETKRQIPDQVFRIPRTNADVTVNIKYKDILFEPDLGYGKRTNPVMEGHPKTLSLSTGAMQELVSIKGKLTEKDVGSYTIKLTSHKKVISEFKLIVKPSNVPPVVKDKIQDIVKKAGESLGVDVSPKTIFSDADGNLSNARPPEVTGLPKSLSLVNTVTEQDFIIGGKLTEDDAEKSPYTIKVTVTDDKGASASTEFTLTVKPKADANKPPSVRTGIDIAKELRDREVTVGEKISLWIEGAGFYFQDDEDNYLTGLSTVTDVPDFLKKNLLDNNITEFAGTPTEKDVKDSPYIIKVSTKDSKGAESETLTLKLTVKRKATTSPTETAKQCPEGTVRQCVSIRRGICKKYECKATAIKEKDIKPKQIEFNIESITQAEGTAGESEYVFTVRLVDGPTEDEVKAQYSVKGSGSNPANADDFVDDAFPQGELIIPAGQEGNAIRIQVKGDAEKEKTEQFTITLSNPSSGVEIKADGKSSIGVIQDGNDTGSSTDTFAADTYQCPVCMNDGECTDGRSCTCPEGFSGEICELADSSTQDTGSTDTKPRKEFKLVEGSRKFLLMDSRLRSGSSPTQFESLTKSVTAITNPTATTTFTPIALTVSGTPVVDADNAPTTIEVRIDAVGTNTLSAVLNGAGAPTTAFTWLAGVPGPGQAALAVPGSPFQIISPAGGIMNAGAVDLIVKRTTDNIFFKISINWTDDGGLANSTLTSMSGFNCGTSQANCP